MCDTLECYSAAVSTMRCNWMPCTIMGIKLGDTVDQEKCKMIHLTWCNELGDTQYITPITILSANNNCHIQRHLVN